MAGLLVFTLLPLLMLWFRVRLEWREAFVAAALAWGVGILLCAEALSAVRAIQFGPVLALWLAANGTMLVLWYRRRQWPSSQTPHPLGPVGSVLGLAIAGLFGLTLVVALVAPPNTPDVLAYHLPRQLMWLQQHSLEHFQWLDDRARIMPPFAEIVQAHALLLSGGDHWANLPQWISYVLAATVASLLAREFGGGPAAQWLAAFFCVTVPMAYHQATSAKNELMVAVWLAILLWEVLRLRAAEPTRRAWLAIGAALGLALATKTTALAFAPIALVFAMPAAIRAPRRALLGLAVAIALVAPHAWRNQAWYGTPLGVHRWEHGGAQGNEIFTARSVASNLIRNAAQHLVTPWPETNARVIAAITRGHRWLGIDVSDRRTTLWYLPFDLSWAPAAEFTAGAPAHFVVGLLALAVWIVRGPRQKPLVIGAVWIVGGAVSYALLVKWQYWGARLHLPLFIALAGFSGCILARQGRAAVLAVAGTCLVGWFPSIETGLRPILTRPTIFAATRWQNYFRYSPIDAELQAATVRALVAADIGSLEVRTRHGALYPLLSQFLAGGTQRARLAGTSDGPPGAPADAVLVYEPFDASHALYYPGAETRGRFRAVASTDPYFVYVPEARARALESKLSLPRFVGWDREENVRLLGYAPPEHPTAPRWQLEGAARLHFQRASSKMELRIEARNLAPVARTIEVRLNGRVVKQVVFDPGEAFQSFGVPLIVDAARNVLELACIDRASGKPIDERPKLLLSKLQIVD